MTALPSTSRHARLLAAALDGERGTGSTSASGSALYEGHTNLVALAGHVQVLAAEPPAPFLNALRERVMVAAVQREAKLAADSGALSAAAGRQGEHGASPAPQLRPRRRGRRALATGVAGVLVTSGTAVGMSAASAQALPGELLYPVKRGVEQVDLALQRSTEGKGLVYLGQAATRLVELEGLLAAEDAASTETQLLAADVITDFRLATEAASLALSDANGSVTGASGDGLDEATDERLGAFLKDSAQTLGELAPVLPPDAYVEAALAVNDLQEDATELCGDCTSPGPGDLVDVPAPTAPLVGLPVSPVVPVSGSGPLAPPGSDAEDGGGQVKPGGDAGSEPGAEAPDDSAPGHPSGQPDQQPAAPGGEPAVPNEPAAEGPVAAPPAPDPGTDTGGSTGPDSGTATEETGGDSGTPDIGAGTDTGGTDSGTAAGTDTGGVTGGDTATDSGGGTDTGGDPGTGTDTGTDGAGGDPVTDADTGSDIGTDTGTDAGTDPGAHTGTDTGGGIGTGSSGPVDDMGGDPSVEDRDETEPDLAGEPAAATP